jgi:adenylate cyclase
VIDTLKSRFGTEPELVQQLHETLNSWNLPKRETALLRSCLKLYQGGDSRYLNHYGPSRTITTVPYHQVINRSFRDPDIFREKAVFIGRSEDLQPENDRGFYSVFSVSAATTISSVELAATAFANLLTDRALRPLRPQERLLLIGLWGFLVGLSCFLLPVARAALSTLTLATIYLSIAYIQLKWNDTWLPVVIPLCIQLPFAFVNALIFHYMTSSRERVNIHKALSYYIPEDVASKLAKKKHPRQLAEESQLMYGVCLATDAGNYTTLSETTDPMTLGQMMN